MLTNEDNLKIKEAAISGADGLGKVRFLPCAGLRFVLRNEKKILQQQWIRGVPVQLGVASIWLDVPLVDGELL